MTSPAISICLPSLNTFRYLPDRVASILGQTETDWELIVFDSYSDDGSWEFFEEVARKDKRVSIAQAPRGLYENWNRCIERARGRYVYMATSDDTMALDCLEKLRAALDEHSDCDLAHCRLLTIDGKGALLDEQSWPGRTSFAQGMPQTVGQKHVRRAPYDGLLHLTGRMVYLSITQLLIRRSLFSKIGVFDSRWGSMGDRHWEMRAGLVSNTVHVPDTWASWRVHPSNATAALDIRSERCFANVEEMIADAISMCEGQINSDILATLYKSWMSCSRDMRKYYFELLRRQGAAGRLLYQATVVLGGGTSTRSEVLRRLWGGAKWPDRAPGELRKWLDSLGTGPAVSLGPFNLA
ncbi:MAG: glycosyltransferase [Bryobacteraceae bacterium]